MDDMRAMNRKLRQAGFAARGLDEAAICQVAADMTDGHIDRETVQMLAAAHGEKQWKRLVDVLVKVGRWETNGTGWYIHDYLEFNPTRAQWLETKAAKQAAGKAGGLAKALADAMAREVTNGMADPTRPARKGPARVREGKSKPTDPVENTAAAQALIYERNEQRRREQQI